MRNSNEDYHDEPRESYDKVIDAFHGLFEILNIALSPDSIYFHCGIDNLEFLKNSLIELLEIGFDSEDLLDSLYKIEFNRKKSLFYDKVQKKKQEKNHDEEKNM